MKKTTVKRLAALLLTLCLILALAGNVFAATGTLKSNSGRRHTRCVSLSSQANKYYTGSYTWEKLSALSGESVPKDSWAAMQDNPLFDALHTLMTDTHTNRNVVYAGSGSNALATYWKSTDTASGAKGYLYFYGDVDSGTTSYTMNREHIWCKANASFKEKGGGADLHHLRPSISYVNQAKGALAFGNVKGKYTDAKASTVGSTAVCWASNSQNLFEVKDDIKGDVARILLYVYCRWEQPNLYSDVEAAKLPPLDADDDLNYGEKVFESLDVILQWMQLDPVDEWEMGRNDQTENVQGNRNVFIDYPELAWLMFGREVPSDMVTPSGKAMYDSHSWDSGVQTTPGCEMTGLVTYTCKDCGKIRTVVLPAAGHKYVNGVCTVCGNANSQEVFVRTNELKDKDEVVLYFPDNGKALSCVLFNSNYRCGESASADGTKLYTDSKNIVWTVEKTDGGFHLRGSDGKLLAADPNNYYLNSSGTDTVWNVAAAKTPDCMYLKSSCGKCVEWVTKYNDFSAYNYSTSYEAVLAMQVYTKQAKAQCPSAEYKDVPDETTWAHKGIDFVIERGIMGSTSTQEAVFESNVSCTRSMIVSMLYRLAGSPSVAYEAKFTDVPANQWFTNAVIWAANKGVVSGYNTGRFGPNDLVTREQMAVILKGYTEKVAQKQTGDRASLADFPDEGKVTWSRDAVRWAVAAGMISGKTSGMQKILDPQGKASRAEVASIMMRFIEKYIDE